MNLQSFSTASLFDLYRHKEFKLCWSIVSNSVLFWICRSSTNSYYIHKEIYIFYIYLARIPCHSKCNLGWPFGKDMVRQNIKNLVFFELKNSFSFDQIYKMINFMLFSMTCKKVNFVSFCFFWSFNLIFFLLEIRIENLSFSLYYFYDKLTHRELRKFVLCW